MLSFSTKTLLDEMMMSEIHFKIIFRERRVKRGYG